MFRIFLRFFALLFGILIPVRGKTDAPDASALGVMYSSLNSPSQLTGWSSSGGDPCGQAWKGIKCSGSSVTEIKLSGLGLTGSMGYQLSSLKSVTYFDLSKNKVQGDIPYQLPPNVRHINLAGNKFTGNIPYSISQMTDLKYLDLGHNKLNGQLSDMFRQLPKLTLLDLSFNSLSGTLPQSFGSLKRLNTLYLQNNKFTGSIGVLTPLPLHDLNIANNQFSGSVPNKLKNIDNIETDGNSWASENDAISKQSKPNGEKGKTVVTGVLIALGVMIVLVLLVILLSSLARKSSSSHASHFIDEEKISQSRSFTPLVSHELKGISGTEFKSLDSSSSFTTKTSEKSGSLEIKPPPPDWHKSYTDDEFQQRFSVRKSASRRSADNRRSTDRRGTDIIRASSFSLLDLQEATSNFGAKNIIGEGSVGRVYKASFVDGKVYAVKRIDPALLHTLSSEQFIEVVSSISRLHHPNITELVGYCSEQGYHLLIYPFLKNGSLHEFLHLSDDYSRPLTWNTRIRIALGTARAIEYLHDICYPSAVHKNIKSANILLDTQLNSQLCDCGLSTFSQSTSIMVGEGYGAPECTTQSSYTSKSDIYSFGVVMLELLTGRRPFDSSKPRAEQSLARWAAPQLQDIGALERMVDPALRGLYPPKSVSRFADVISLCIQTEPDFRPSIAEVVESLIRCERG